MIKLPILPCAEKLESYFCLPHQKHEITPTKRVKTENGPISRGSQSEMSMVKDLWGKRFTKKVSFEFRVKEWRGDGRGEWRTGGWIEASIKRWSGGGSRSKNEDCWIQHAYWVSHWVEQSVGHRYNIIQLKSGQLAAGILQGHLPTWHVLGPPWLPCFGDWL